MWHEKFIGYNTSLYFVVNLSQESYLDEICPRESVRGELIYVPLRSFRIWASSNLLILIFTRSSIRETTYANIIFFFNVKTKDSVGRGRTIHSQRYLKMSIGYNLRILVWLVDFILSITFYSEIRSSYITRIKRLIWKYRRVIDKNFFCAADSIIVKPSRNIQQCARESSCDLHTYTHTHSQTLERMFEDTHFMVKEKDK